MGLADSIKQHETFAARGKCKMCDIIIGLSKDDAEALEQALADKNRFTAPAIKMILADEGISVSTDVIQKHRREK